MALEGRPQIKVFTTCPQSSEHEPGHYLARVAEVARWSEAIGATGILVYADNSLVDPWAVAQEIIGETETLSPLLAVQPAYLHPYVAAKRIASIGFLYGRRVYLNMVAGGFRGDLEALGDTTSHDDRYRRLTDYTKIIFELLAGQMVDRDGPWYRAKHLRLDPALEESLRPGLLMSGSSAAGREAADELGATIIEYPEPASNEPPVVGDQRSGIRVGIIARNSAAEAWDVANERFPPDRRGQIKHQLAMKASDSHWHQTLSDLAARLPANSTYWLGPFVNSGTFCPYLVGSHDEVADELSHYARAGHRTIILDIPPNEADLHHAGTALERVTNDIRQHE